MRRQVSRLRRDLGEEMEIVTDPAAIGYAPIPDAWTRWPSSGGSPMPAALPRPVSWTRPAVSWPPPEPVARSGPSDLRGAYFEAEAALLEERHLMAQDEYAETRMAGGEHRDLIGELTARVSRYPMRERPRAQLMLALHRAGRQAEALETYRRGARSARGRTRPGAVAGAGPAAPGDSDVGGRPPPRVRRGARSPPAPSPFRPPRLPDRPPRGGGAQAQAPDLERSAAAIGRLTSCHGLTSPGRGELRPRS